MEDKGKKNDGVVVEKFMPVNIEVAEGAKMPTTAYDPTCNLFDLFTMIAGREKEIYTTNNQPAMAEKEPLNGKIIIASHSIMRIPTGIKIELPVGFYGDIKPRSSLFLKGVNIAGIVDSDYRGEIFVIVQNMSVHAVEIEHHQRIAQMAILKKENISLQRVLKIDSGTARGEQGFGSSGSASKEECCNTCERYNNPQWSYTCPQYFPMTKKIDVKESELSTFKCHQFWPMR